MAGILLVLLLGVMIIGLLSAQERMDPDEEARLLAEQEAERKRRKEMKRRQKQ